MAYFPSSKDSPKTRKILAHCCSPAQFSQRMNHAIYCGRPLLFLCRDTGFLEELVEAEEFAAEGAGVGRPLGFAGVDGEGGAGGGEFRIEIVEIVEDEGFADHGELGRAEFVLAVMAD